MRTTITKKQGIYMTILIACYVLGLIGFTSFASRTRGQGTGDFVGPSTLFEAITQTFLILGIMLIPPYVLILDYESIIDIKEEYKTDYYHAMWLMGISIYLLLISLLLTIWNVYLFEPLILLIYILLGGGLIGLCSTMLLFLIKKIPWHPPKNRRPNYAKGNEDFKKSDKNFEKRKEDDF